MRYLFLLFLVLAAPAHATAKKPQVAAVGSGILAVVNDEAISSYDLNARIQFVLATTKISSSPESIARLKPQILRALIDERLQLQEARKNQIELDPKEVDQAIAAIENQRGIPAGGIMQMLKANRIPPETFLSQVRAQIVWGKLLQRKVRSRIKITDEEVAQMTRRLSQPIIKREMKIALFQLPVDKPEREREVRQAAEKLVLEVRGGADFEELARQFAGGAARENLNLPTFWVMPDDLEPVIAKALTGAQAGYVSDPLRNALGYTIIKVYETRDLPGQQGLGTEVTLKEIILKFRSSADTKDMAKLQTVAQEVAKNPGSCESDMIGTVRDADLAAIEVNKSTQMMAELPSSLRVIADGMKVGDVSSPFAGEDGIYLYVLCGKREGVKATVDEKRAKSAVFQQRMELEAQKYMRNLRRDGFIEVRGL